MTIHMQGHLQELPSAIRRVLNIRYCVWLWVGVKVGLVSLGGGVVLNFGIGWDMCINVITVCSRYVKCEGVKIYIIAIIE